MSSDEDTSADGAIDEVEETVMNQLRKEGILEKVAKLMAMASASVMGYQLLENPIGFVLATIAKFIMNLMIQMAGRIGTTLYILWDQLTIVLVGSGAAGVAPFANLGGMLLDTVSAVDHNLTVFASDLGPAAPFLVIGFWAVVMWALFTYGRRAIAALWGALPWT